MLITFVVLALAVGYVSFIYNSIVRHSFLVREGWSLIDVQLKKRHELVPNLVELVKQYAKHEKETFEGISRLRSESSEITSNANKDLERKSSVEKDFAIGVRRVIALVENYPELKADTNFRKLQDNLIEIEDHLQYARRYYSGAVRDYNTIIESFPANLIARSFGFKQANFFEIELVSEKHNPEVRL